MNKDDNALPVFRENVKKLLDRSRYLNLYVQMYQKEYNKRLLRSEIERIKELAAEIEKGADNL